MANNLGVSSYTVGGDYDAWGAKFVADMAILNKFAGDTYLTTATTGTVTMSVTDAQNFSIQANGGTASTVDIRVPDSISRYWYARNDRSSGSITIRCAAGGTAVTIPAGERRLVYSDGVNCVDLTVLTLSITSVSGLQAALDLKANLAGPTFTGVPAAPTAAPGTNTTQISTTAFVKAAIDVVLGGVSASFDTLSEIAAVLTFASTADVRAGTAGKIIKADDAQAAMAWVALTDAATVTPDHSTGTNFTLTMAGNRTIAAPTNGIPGLPLILRLKQDATGSRVPAFNSAYDFGDFGTPALSSGANQEDMLTFVCVSSSKFAFTGIRKRTD